MHDPSPCSCQGLALGFIFGWRWIKTWKMLNKTNSKNSCVGGFFVPNLGTLAGLCLEVQINICFFNTHHRLEVYKQSVWHLVGSINIGWINACQERKVIISISAVFKPREKVNSENINELITPRKALKIHKVWGQLKTFCISHQYHYMILSANQGRCLLKFLKLS